MSTSDFPVNLNAMSTTICTIEGVEACQRIIQRANTLLHLGRSWTITHDNAVSRAPSTLTLPSLELPNPSELTSQLIDLGLERSLAQHASEDYLLHAMELKHRAELAAHRACEAVANLPQPSELMPLNDLHQGVFASSLKVYLETLDEYRNRAMKLARTHIADTQRRRDLPAHNKYVPPPRDSSKGRPNFNQVASI